MYNLVIFNCFVLFKFCIRSDYLLVVEILTCSNLSQQVAGTLPDNQLKSSLDVELLEEIENIIKL